MADELNELLSKIDGFDKESEKMQKVIDKLKLNFEKSIAGLYDELKICKLAKQGLINQINDKGLIKIKLGDLKSNLRTLTSSKIEVFYDFLINTNRQKIHAVVISVKNIKTGTTIDFFRSFDEKEKLADGTLIIEKIYVDKDNKVKLNDSVIGDIILKCDYHELENLNGDNYNDNKKGKLAELVKKAIIMGTNKR